MSEIDQIRRLTAANIALNEQVAACREKNLILIDLNNRLKIESDWDRKQLRTIRTSVSWRITAPIRMVKRNLYRTFKKFSR